MKGKKIYRINEIFYSIQGEGQYAGSPMVFVRFSGCNLSCPFCDTKHESSCDMTADEILLTIEREIWGYKIKHVPVCFTGGEPTLQIDTSLINLILDKKHEIHLETNGTRPIPKMESFKNITISPKSNIIPKSLLARALVMCNVDLKIVYDTSQMLLLNSLIHIWGNRPVFTHKYIQPVTYKNGNMNIRSVIEFIKANPEWSMSLQTQCLINIK